MTAEDVVLDNVRDWRIEVDYAGSASINDAYMSGFSGSVSTGFIGPNGQFAITTEGVGYRPELEAGFQLVFNLQGQGSGFEESDFSITFVNLTEQPTNTFSSELVSVNDWYNPAWGGGFNASFRCDVLGPNTANGPVTDLLIEFNYSGAGTPSNAWTQSHNGPIEIGFIATDGGYAIANVEGFQPELFAGDAITFAIQVQGAGFSEDDFDISCGPSGGIAVNTPPTIEVAQIDALEDQAVTVPVLVADAEGDTVTLEIATPPANGMASIDATSITYTPNANFYGSDQIVVAATDSEGNSTSLEIPITIASVNDAPILAAANYTLKQRESVDVVLSASDVDGDELSYRLIAEPLHGDVDTTAPLWTYTPSPDFYGSDEITVVANDGSIDSEPVVITFDIERVNRAPVIESNPVLLAKAGEPYRYQLVVIDADDDPLSYRLTEAPSDASITEAGLLTWIPQAGNAEVAFAIEVADDGDGIAIQQFSVMVAPTEVSPDYFGDEFWLTFMPNSVGVRNILPELFLFVSALEDTTGTIEILATGTTLTFVVQANSTVEILLPEEDTQAVIPRPAFREVESLAIHGLRVTTDRPVMVHALNSKEFTSDGMLVYPVDSLGTNYVPITYDTRIEAGTSQLAVLATDDDTIIDFVAAFDVSHENYNEKPTWESLSKKGETFRRVLQQGEVYFLTGHVAGTQISSTKPIAVFSGNECEPVNMNGLLSCDHLVEQQVPTRAFGTTYYAVPLTERPRGDLFVLVAAEDDTDIEINGQRYATLSKGDTLDLFLDEPSTFSANKPFAVAQFQTSARFDTPTNDFLDPFMLNLVPESQWLSTYVVPTPTDKFTSNFIGVVSPQDVLGSVMLDGEVVDAALFQSYPDTGYSYARLPVSAGVHTIEADGPIGISLFGYAQFDSYGMAGGQRIPRSAEFATVDVTSPLSLVQDQFSEACLSFSVRDETGAAMAGTRIDVVSEGVNADEHTVFSNEMGEASFCYDGLYLGVDRLSASVGSSLSEDVVIDWVAGDLEPPGPVIKVHPSTDYRFSVPYSSTIVAESLDGSAVSYALLEGPARMSIDPISGVIETFRASVILPFSVSATDGAGRVSTFDYVLLEGLVNRPPTIKSEPTTTVARGQIYYSIVEMEDLDRTQYRTVPTSLQSHLIDPIDGMSARNWAPQSNRIRWQVPYDYPEDSVDVQIIGADRQGGYTDIHSFTLHVTDNLPVVVNQAPLTHVVAGEVYRYYSGVVDPESLGQITSILVEGPVGMYASRTAVIWASPSLADVGDHPVVVDFYDEAGNATRVSYTLTVLAEPNTPPALLSSPPLTATTGVEYRYEMRAEDDNGNELTFAAVTLPAGALFDAESGALTWTPDEGQIGSQSFVLTVSDRFDTTEQAFDVAVEASGGPLMVTIDAPPTSEVITAPTDIVASLQGGRLSSWRVLLYSGRGDGEPEVLATGEGLLDQEVVAVFDPTMRRNGAYRLVLEGRDTAGQLVIHETSILVEGDLKIGNFSIAFQDLSVPIVGIPIQVTRQYDSRDRANGLDFGQGWSIDYQNVTVEESRSPGLGWSLVEMQTGPLGSLVDYCVLPDGKPFVSVTLPDGQVEAFDIAASPECNLIPLRDVNFNFRPRAGTTSTLRALDESGGRLIDETRSIAEPTTLEAIDPTRYELTTKAGYIYTLNQGFGIETVEDPNGHTLTYSDDGITHSAGLSIDFVRDAEGRITEISDPSGEFISYRYDANGNLDSVTDRAFATTDFTYDASHGLIDIIDPLGRRVVRNLYDDDGRLIAQEDNEGNRTAFDHNIEGRQSVVFDRLGRPTTFGYDDRGNVTTRVDALGQTTSYTFDADDNQLSETNALGETSSARYDARRNQLTQTDPLGNTVAFSYNARGQELNIRDARGNEFQNAYDTYGNLLGVTDPAGYTAQQNINAQGLVSSREDAEGFVTAFAYDTQGNLIRETDAEGGLVTYTYDENNNRLSETRRRTVDGVSVLETTRYTYDVQDRVVSTIDALGNQTRTEYDLLGREVAMIDAFARRTTMGYDAYGRLLWTRHPDGTSDTSTYDMEGNKLSDTDRLGRTTRYRYDALNRLVETTYADFNSMSTTYDAAGRVVAETDERANTTAHAYDAAGRRVSTTDALGNIATFSYDDDGNMTGQMDARGHITRYTYNSLDQRIETHYADSTMTSSVYDGRGLEVSNTDQNGRTTRFGFDGLGRLTGVTDVLGQETRYGYDGTGNKLTQTDAQGRTTQWAYDALGRSISRNLPLGQQENYSYDAVGNRIEHTDFNGATHTYRYDASNDWLTEERWADGRITSYQYNAIGQRISATDSNGTFSYSYDDRDRLISEMKHDGSELIYDYDASGNRTTLTVMAAGAASTTTYYGFDALNRLQSVTAPDGRVTTYDYDANGNQTSVIHGNGTRSETEFDALNRIELITQADAANQTLAEFRYTLDATGRRTAIAEANGRRSDYTYDDLYRLTQEIITDPVNGDHQSAYQYDATGNRSYETVNDVQTAYTYDDNDRLLQTGGTYYTYDANGNTLSETLDFVTSTNTWDSQNRLVGRDTNGQGIVMTYDMDGNRLSKSVDGESTAYLVDTNRPYAQVVHEANSTDELAYTYGTDLLTLDSGIDSFSYHTDALGSTRLLTGSAGVVADEINYDAWGEQLSGGIVTENSYRYTGEQFDSALGHYYLRARYYSPESARFDQMDTWSGNSEDPITLNKFIYGNVDPSNGTDPSGRFTLASLGVASNVRSTIIDLQIQGGFSLLDLGLGASGDENAQQSARDVQKIVAIVQMGAAGVQLVKLLSRKAAVFLSKNKDRKFQKNGDTIALGLSDNLDEFTHVVNGKNWKQWAKDDPINWQAAFSEVVSDPKNQVAFDLSGVDVFGGVSRAASGRGGATDWELLMIRSNRDWWSRITWFKNGVEVVNPFQ